MFSRNLHPAGFCLPCLLFLFIGLGCGNASDSATPPDAESPIGLSTMAIECDVDLGLGPEDAAILDFTDQEKVWRAAWDGEALILTRNYSCGDECSEEEILRIEDALVACPQRVGVRVTLRDRGSPDWKAQITEARDGTLTLQDWEVEPNGPVLVSGRVDAGMNFVFYLDTRED